MNFERRARIAFSILFLMSMAVAIITIIISTGESPENSLTTITGEYQLTAANTKEFSIRDTNPSTGTIPTTTSSLVTRRTRKDCDNAEEKVVAEKAKHGKLGSVVLILNEQRIVAYYSEIIVSMLLLTI